MTQSILFVKDLSKEQLLKTARDLVQFTDFTFFEERNVSAGTGLVFAMEMQAVQLGLVGDELYAGGDYDSATMMDEFANAINKAATEASVHGWDSVAKELPYGTF